jgi:hypothetical protein
MFFSPGVQEFLGILFPGNDIRYYHRSPQDELGLALATSRL